MKELNDNGTGRGEINSTTKQIEWDLLKNHEGSYSWLVGWGGGSDFFIKKKKGKEKRNNI